MFLSVQRNRIASCKAVQHTVAPCRAFSEARSPALQSHLLVHVLAAVAPPESLLEMLHVRPQPSFSELESAFEKDVRVICVHVNT